MQPNEHSDSDHFRHTWPRDNFFRLRRYTSDELKMLGLPKQHAALLREIWLPSEAAPFLVFDDPALPRPLETWELPDAVVEHARVPVTGRQRPVLGGLFQQLGGCCGGGAADACGYVAHAGAK